VQVGILALQGDVALHRAAFARLGLTARDVRAPRELDGLTHLVLPGGESTTLWRLMTLFGVWEPIRARVAAGELPVLGTCAGAVLLGQAAADERRAGTSVPPRMELVDAVVRRNAYGRQLASRTVEVELGLDGDAPSVRVPCTFIRAPRIDAVGPDVRVLASASIDGGPATPILIEAPGILAATFHPELLEDPLVHRRFLETSLERVR
jgi:5'-phosphate synthase pdxT subunit